MTWVRTSNAEKYECTYSNSGNKPLLCACGAFGVLAVATVMEHAYMLVAISKSTDLEAWDPDSKHAKTLTWQAAFFFFATW